MLQQYLPFPWRRQRVLSSAHMLVLFNPFSCRHPLRCCEHARFRQDRGRSTAAMHGGVAWLLASEIDFFLNEHTLPLATS